MEITPRHARIRFGAEVRKLRERAGLTQQQLARAVPMAQSHISAIERGTKGTKQDQITQLDRVLNARGTLARRWHDLNQRDGYPEWFKGIVPLEQEAAMIWEYDPLLVPGLLQVESYARTIISLGSPTNTLTETDDAVQARMKRQGVLSSDRSPMLMVVLDETVLHRPIGGRESMLAQLQHLLKACDSPRITVQVIPVATEQHPGLDGAFKVITTPDKGRIVFLETRATGTPIDDPPTVERFVSLYGDLRGIALPPATSRQLIEKALGEFCD